MNYYVINNSLFNDIDFAYGIQREGNFNTGQAKYCPECLTSISMLE